MDTQTTTVEVDLATAATLQMLKTRAEAQGIPLNSLLLSLTQATNASPQQRAQELVEWLQAQAVSVGTADDSRESIYTREDEAL